MDSTAEKGLPGRPRVPFSVICLLAALVFFIIASASMAPGGDGGTALHTLKRPSASTKTEPATGLNELSRRKQRGIKTISGWVAPQGAGNGSAEKIQPPDFTRGDKRGMEVAVTFDGGGGDDTREAEYLLDTLRKHGVTATVFLTGEFIRDNPEIVRKIVRDGHEVGNHTMTHPHLTDYARNFTHKTLDGVDAALIIRELEGAASLFREVTGRDMAPLWRAPYGEVNGEVRRWAWEAGYIHVGWTNDYRKRQSLDTLDWVRDPASRFYRTSSEIKDRVLAFGNGGNGVSGGIILMHLNTGRASDRAADMLGEMLDTLHGRGYRFVKVSTLMAGNRFLEQARQRRSGRIASASETGAGTARR